MQYLCLVFILLSLSFPVHASPQEAITLALQDIRQQPPNIHSQIRYLSLVHLPDKEKDFLLKVLSFHCNALSRESDIVIPTVVPKTNGSLLRINLADYEWSASVWDQLFDPIFTVKIQVGVIKNWPGGIWWEDRKYYPPNAFRYRPKEVKTALAPWLPTAEAAELVNLTQSSSPVVRGDWFLWQTSLQVDRVPGYYDFIGVKNKKDFDSLVGFDAKLAKSAKRVELLEAVAHSIVTLQPRRIGAFPSLSGWYWQTFDSRLAVDENNPLRILNGDHKFDAQEVFGHGPNGLMIWGLFDAKGDRQDAAPDFIASDATAPGTDRRVHVNLSCVRCHGQNSGINPVDGWARNLFTGDLRLQSPDYEKLKELRQKYLRDLESPIEDSRRIYARAIAQATGGMKAMELSSAYGQAFANYDTPVSLERAARDAGLTPEDFQNRIKTYLLKTGSVDTVVAGFLGKRKGGIPPVQYHEAIPIIQNILFGTVK